MTRREAVIGRYERGKRCLDLGVAGGLLAVTAPVLLVLLLAIRLDSPGAPVFVQTRAGRHGRRFRIYKLRTMHLDAEARLENLRQEAGLPGPVFKLRGDPRVTRLGRWLRRLSLDELPQLINILRGEMSLVGPRPLPPSQMDPGDERFRRRLAVLPGLTGQWQVTGRVMHVDYDRWLAQDCWYVEHRSLGLDLAILARTLPAVWHGRGAW